MQIPKPLSGHVPIQNDNVKSDNSAKTGDETPVTWMFILMLLSAAGMVAEGRRRKKNQK